VPPVAPGGGTGSAPAAGIAVTVRAAGDPRAPLVVLVHGALDRGASFGRVADHLTELNLILYDRRGYEGSLHATPPADSLADHAADLLALIGDRRATVVAHSFGSHVAVLAAIAGPRHVASVGLWEPPVPWMEFWPAQARATVAAIAGAPDPGDVGELAYKTMVGRGAWERLSESTRRRRRAEGVAFRADIASELEAPYEWEDLGVPCVIGYGGSTWAYTSEAARRVAALLDCPSFVIAGAGHMAHATHPEGFAGFVRRSVELAAP